ncbi:MAG TPA: penicillin-insensitive murein endopeptidase [Polyangiaceae bacterium]|nr:penicillin-insensitive murein endopeptidase [Polyangiaceae bacterium]
MRTATLALAALTAISTIATGALPGPARPAMTTARMSLGPAALRYGRSIGSPTEGHLVGGTHLDETAYLRVMPADAAGDVRWGLEPLVEMIDRAARTVRRLFPGTVTSVGHLSREGGGDIERHRSHESGRDADIGFFVRSSSGRQLFPEHFVAFRADGSAVGWPGAYFDDARNWALAAAMVEETEAHVTHIFISSPLRARLLAYAQGKGVETSVRARVAEVLQQPHGALPHDDHFHVRIGCPSGMNGCIENPATRAAPSGRRPTHRHVTTPPTPRQPRPARSEDDLPIAPRESPSRTEHGVSSASVDDVDG